MSGKREHKGHSSPSADTGGIHSNAYNFLSAVNTGVDPRTGMYSASISLPGVAANNLCGPTVGLSVSFSALNPVDAGFGIGWSLTTTRYDTRRRRLSLSSGESFLVDDFDVANDTARFKDRKLRSFDLIRVGLAGDFRIVHKAGHSEHLKVLPGSDDVAVLHELRSPEGYVVTLDQGAAGGIVKLRAVTDGTGRVLLSVAYGIADTRVTLHPDTPQAVSFTFYFSNDWLTRLDLPEGYGDGWAFGYEERLPARRSWWQRIRSWLGQDDSPRAELGLLLLNSVTVPTGGREEATYRHDGHVLPGGAERPLSHMPFVTRFQRFPGHNQPAMDTRYEYSKRNFFGYDVLTDWLDNEDNLYRVVMPVGQHFEYSSTERLYDGADPIRTIVRTFNRFHLMTSEHTSQEGCIKEVVTEYDDNPSTSFANQVPWCQLPVRVYTRYSREGDASPGREDVEAYTYDTEGNRLTHRDTDGAQEEFTYYLALGEEGCPADPLGFVRCLKQKRVSPPVGTEGLVRVTRHRYEVMPSLISGAPGHLHAVYEGIHHEVAGRVDPLPVVESRQRFFTDRGPDHGRLSQAVTAVGGVDATTDYTYVNGGTVLNAKGVDEPALIVIEARTASTGKDDALSFETRGGRSLYSGMSLMEEGPDEVVTRFAYDALGRLVARSLAGGTPYAAASSIAHVLSHEKSSQEECSVTGRRVRSELDGFGRAVRGVAVDWLGDGNEHEIWHVAFDALGRTASETMSDYGVPLASGEMGELSATASYRYDAWGNLSQSVAPDGVISHTRVDPIARTEESWTEAPGSSGPVGRTHTTVGKDGRPERKERRDSQGTPQWWRTYTYDGWGRCLSDTESAPDMPDKVTRYRYDDFDRPTETTLADGSVVYRKYAAYIDDAQLVEAIGVRHTPAGAEAEIDSPLGQQVFDGLRRRVLFRSGTREIRYVYGSPRSAEADEIHLPSGEILSCTYEKQLGQLPTSISDSSRTVVCQFEYHGLLGQRTVASNAFGRQETEYLPGGQVKSERFLYGTQGDTRQQDFTYTLRGKRIGHTSVDGESHTVRYDELGRVAMIQNGVLSTRYTYDAFSRRKQVKTETVDGQRSMAVSLAYDEYGREIERNIVARADSLERTQTMTQSYTAADKLRTRRWASGEEAREEAYEYDIRGRLVGYVCNGSHAPKDLSGLAVASQNFAFDALDNLLSMETTYAQAGVAPRISTFHHALADPTQLIRIEHVQGANEETVVLEYDDCGNLKRDEQQRELTYDAMGRLSAWTNGSTSQAYQYDPLDRVGAIDGPTSKRLRYYHDGQIAWENAGATSSSFHVFGGSCLAQSTLDAGGRRTVLLGSDTQGSVVSEAGATLAALAYLVYGYRPDDEGDSDVAYAGELVERALGWYFQSSFRIYNPQLMRFHSPDAASPFGHGGLNCYAYVSGDPVNRVDPSGEGFLDWLLVGIGAIGTIIGVALSAGTLAPAATALWLGAAVSTTQAAAVVSTGVGALSFWTGAASVVLNQTGQEKAGRVLGWMSMGYGVGSGLANEAPAIGRALSSAVDKVRGWYKAISELPWRLRNAGGANSKGSSMWARQARRWQGWEPLEEGPPPLPPRRSGVANLNRHVQYLAENAPSPRGLVTERLGRTFEHGFDEFDSLDVGVLLNGRGRTASTMGRIDQYDLTRSGFTDNELLGLIDNVSIPADSSYALNQRTQAWAHFRRFMATNDVNSLHEAADALALSRNAEPTHVALPAWRRPPGDSSL